MYTYREITQSEEKHSICNHILRALPDWFGIEGAIVEYCEGVKTKPFFAVFDNENTTVGFVALQPTSTVASEVYVMGVLQSHHGNGIGKRLIDWCATYARSENKKLLLVKTLSAAHPDMNYAQTRLFYKHVGFTELEELPELWGASCPCLNMVMFL